MNGTFEDVLERLPHFVEEVHYKICLHSLLGYDIYPKLSSRQCSTSNTDGESFCAYLFDELQK